MNRRTILVPVISGAVSIIAGVIIGVSAVNTHSSEITSLKAQLSRARTSLSNETSELRTAQSNIISAQAQAAQAKTAAQVQARRDYASKMAQANSLLSKLHREQRVVQSSTISGNGVYVVGRDIPSGTYHTPGDGQPGSLGCYYATLNSTNTSDIVGNNNFDGPETVDVSGAYAFQISGGCTWTKVG